MMLIKIKEKVDSSMKSLKQKLKFIREKFTA